MNIRFNWWQASPARAPQRPKSPDWVDARNDLPASDDGAAVKGCGWFDSSHELHTGLQVTEHLTPQPVADEVPLGWWLDWQMAAPALQPGGVRQ